MDFNANNADLMQSLKDLLNSKIKEFEETKELIYNDLTPEQRNELVSKESEMNNVFSQSQDAVRRAANSIKKNANKF